MAIILTVLVFSLCMVMHDSAQGCPVIGGSGIYTYDPNASNGPSDWGNIMMSFSTCGSGTSQSPIDISSSTPTSGAPPTFTAATAMYDLKSSTENWALDCKSAGTCGSVNFDGKDYDVVNLHFHAPSEHTVNGASFPLESHLVHTNGTHFFVLATLFSICDGIDSPLLNQVLGGICSPAVQFNVRPHLVLVGSNGFYIYDGSLTTPPCSEGVTFCVQRNIKCVSQAQVDDYVTTSGATSFGNNRPVQPLNSRTVHLYP